MPPSDPPPPSQPPASGPPASGTPASQPPASGPAPVAPASADTINQALDAVKAAFPPDSSILSDLQLTASDDTTASVTVVLNDQSDQYGTDGAWPIVSSIWDQFDALAIPQEPTVSFCLASDPSVLSLDDLSHHWCFLHGAVSDDGSGDDGSGGDGSGDDGTSS